MGLKHIFYGRLRRVHFIGIGGIGMSGLAEILIHLGFQVSGSDTGHNDSLARLCELGAIIYPTHESEQVHGADVVVYSSAIPPHNPELMEAKRLHIPVIPRAQLLAEIMRLKNGIAVSGAHGKTTTTSLIAHILQEAHLDPTVIIGGKVNHMGTNARLGEGAFVVAEADESDGSFMLLSPNLSVITNIDPEHLDHFKGGLEQIKQIFMDFANQLPFYGLLVACLDDPNVASILPLIQKRMVTYGIDQVCDLRASHIQYTGLTSRFHVYERGALLGEVELNLAGKHNILNSLAAIAICMEIGVAFDCIQQALKSFKGVHRRFTFVGKAKQGQQVIDDYGHHPTEIAAVLSTAKEAFPNCRLRVLFQPHRYSRTALLWNDFIKSLSLSDELILLPIYAASEVNTYQVSSEQLAMEMQKSHSHVTYQENLGEVLKYLLKTTKPNDLILTLGAGDVTQYGAAILRAFDGQV